MSNECKCKCKEREKKVDEIIKGCFTNNELEEMMKPACGGGLLKDNDMLMPAGFKDLQMNF